MTIFVDASALVAMMSGEPEAADLEEKLHGFHTRLTSGMAIWETTVAIARQGQSNTDAALADVERVCRLLNLTLVPIGSQEAAEAIRAHARYGKGTGHPARLNMGDCFAYACARTNNARLLYKGEDFIHTDMA